MWKNGLYIETWPWLLSSLYIASKNTHPHHHPDVNTQKQTKIYNSIAQLINFGIINYIFWYK